jgi:membrane protein required for colicin V production
VTWIDAAIVVIMLFFVVTAFQGGLVREVIAFASTLAGIVIAGIFYDDLRDTLFTSIDNQTVASAVSFLSIFAGITVAGQLLAMVVHPMIQVLQLGMADQFLGAAFGAVKGFILIEALLILFVTYPFWDMDQEIDKSEFATRLLNVATPVTNVLPEIFQSKVDAFTDGDIAPIRDS